MRSLFGVLFFLSFAGFSFADGDGVGVLPFTSANCSGTIEVNQDGTVNVTGVVRGVAFHGSGRASQDGDGHMVIDCAVEAELGRKLPYTDQPIHVELSLDPDKYDPGDGQSEPVGTVDVEGGLLGRGSIQVYG